MVRRKNRLPFRLDQTALEIVPKPSVLRTSDSLGWPNINISVVAAKPDKSPLRHPAVPDLWLAMSLSPSEFTLVTGGKKRDLSISDNMAFIIAPGTPLVADGRTPGTMLHAFVKRTILSEVANDLFERDIELLELDSSFGVEDPGLTSLLHSLKASLSEPAGDADLKVEYLTRALAAHVLRKNTTVVHTEPAAVVQLTNRQARLVEDYVRDHLSSKIVLKDLASLLDLSQTSLFRRFKGSFQQSAHQYIMAERVRRARELLERSTLSIAQVAAVCGFADPTHLGVVFKRLLGVTPSQYRKLVQ